MYAENYVEFKNGEVHLLFNNKAGTGIVYRAEGWHVHPNEIETRDAVERKEEPKGRIEQDDYITHPDKTLPDGRVESKFTVARETMNVKSRRKN